MARRRRGGHGGGHANSERWLLTYSDLITLLLAFFIIMYAMSKTDVAKYQQLSASLSKAFNVVDTGGANDKGLLPPASDKILPAVIPMPEEKLLSKLKTKIEGEAKEAGLSGKVEVSVTERGLVISINNAAFFDPGEATIKPSIMPVFSRMMTALARMPNHIRIEGHTDNTPICTGRFPSNWELSTTRATNVVRYLVAAGIISPRRLSAAGYSEYSPKFPNDTESHRAQNRRVDVVVVRSTLLNQEP